MTEEQARHLADKIIATWPTSAKHYIWKEILLPLDHHSADVTYRTLRDTAKKTPIVGEFRGAYDTTRVRLRKPTPDELPDHRPAGELISLNEYLHRLEARAQHNPDAAEEFKRWTRRNHPTTRERT